MKFKNKYFLLILLFLSFILLFNNYYFAKDNCNSINKIEELECQIKESQKREEQAKKENKNNIIKVSNIEDEILKIEKEIKEVKKKIIDNNKETKRTEKIIRKNLEFIQSSTNINLWINYLTDTGSINEFLDKTRNTENIQNVSYENILKLNKQEDLLRSMNKEQKQKTIKLAKLEKQLHFKIAKNNKKIDEENLSQSEAQELINNLKSAEVLAAIEKIEAEPEEPIVVQEKPNTSNESSNNNAEEEVVTSSGRLLRPFSYGTINGNYPGHAGIDVVKDRGVQGSPILAGDSGVVVLSMNSSSFGYVTYVLYPKIDKDTVFVYAHMQSFPNYNKGDYVNSNSILGYLGSTGQSTGPHLHIEARSIDDIYSKGYPPYALFGLPRPVNNNDYVNWQGR